MHLARALYKNEFNLDQLHSLTQIDYWFLYRMNNIIDMYKKLEKFSVIKIKFVNIILSFIFQIGILPVSLLIEAKQLGFGDKQVSRSIEG